MSNSSVYKAPVRSRGKSQGLSSAQEPENVGRKTWMSGFAGRRRQALFSF